MASPRKHLGQVIQNILYFEWKKEIDELFKKNIA